MRRMHSLDDDGDEDELEAAEKLFPSAKDLVFTLHPFTLQRKKAGSTLFWHFVERFSVALCAIAGLGGGAVEEQEGVELSCFDGGGRYAADW